MSSDPPIENAPLNWVDWSRKWKPLILKQRGHLGHEWAFAQNVIMEVPGLKPSHVVPQHPFNDNDGVERYIDYAIFVGELKIAIEVEGWDKSNSGHGKTRKEHDLFNRRIQSLTTQGWKVLPVTNAQHNQEPAYYQHQIRLLLIEAENNLPIPAVVPISTTTGQSNKSSKRTNLIIGLLVVVASIVGAYFLFNPGNSKDCADWSDWKPANTWFKKYHWIYGDVANLDRDGNGIPCEALPGAP